MRTPGLFSVSTAAMGYQLSPPLFEAATSSKNRQPEHCEGACLSQTAQVDMLTNGRGRGTEATGCRLFVGSADSGWCAAENAAENIVHSEIMFPFLAITLNKLHCAAIHLLQQQPLVHY